MSQNSDEELPGLNNAMSEFTNAHLRFEKGAEVKSATVFALFVEFLRTHNPRLFMDFNTQKSINNRSAEQYSCHLSKTNTEYIVVVVNRFSST